MDRIIALVNGQILHFSPVSLYWPYVFLSLYGLSVVENLLFSNTLLSSYSIRKGVDKMVHDDHTLQRTLVAA